MSNNEEKRVIKLFSSSDGSSGEDVDRVEASNKEGEHTTFKKFTVRKSKILKQPMSN